MASHGDGNKRAERMSANEGERGDKSKETTELQRILFESRREGQASSDRSNQSSELSDKKSWLKQFYEASEEAGIMWPKPNDGSAPWEDPNHPIHTKRTKAPGILSRGLARPEGRNPQGQALQSDAPPAYGPSSDKQ
jgi:hypothetical protein